MRVYVSGPMRGLPNNNLKEFERIGALLNDRGYDVLNPSNTRWGSNGTRPEYLREDVTMLLIADAVVVLPGWQTSPGAKLEVALGWSFELPVYSFAEYRDNWYLIPLGATEVSIPSEKNKYPLVALCGYAQSGKDTFANVLVEDGSPHPDGGRRLWSRIAFADPLKDVARSIGWDGEKDDTGRVLLQNLGVGVRQHLFTDLWVQKAESIIDGIDGSVVITDARFPNELEMVRRRGGILMWIARPGVGPINGHVSEHSVSPDDCDYVYENSRSIDHLRGVVPELLEDIIRDHR